MPDHLPEGSKNMSWYTPGEPILSPGKQIESKYPGMKIPVLPARAVVFCLGKGMPVLKEHYSCHQLCPASSPTPRCLE